MEDSSRGWESSRWWEAGQRSDRKGWPGTTHLSVVAAVQHVLTHGVFLTVTVAVTSTLANCIPSVVSIEPPVTGLCTTMRIDVRMGMWRTAQ